MDRVVVVMVALEVVVAEGVDAGHAVGVLVVRNSYIFAMVSRTQGYAAVSIDAPSC
jgi:hypothetical protein